MWINNDQDEGQFKCKPKSIVCADVLREKIKFILKGTDILLKIIKKIKASLKKIVIQVTS